MTRYSTNILGGLWGGLGLMMTSSYLAIAPVQAQDVAVNPPIFDNIQLSPNFKPDPKEVRGVSGGSEPTGKIAQVQDTPTGRCVGFVDQTPDHHLTLTQFFSYLKISVQSDGDTVLLVKGPGGVWCSDDSQDQNPVIVGEWKKGDYDIWVGSRNKKAYPSYVLQITQKD